MLLLTKAVFAIMIGFLSSTVLGLFLIPLLKKIHLGQKISVFVGEAHRKKEGTPTMGGLIFIVPTVLSTLALIFTDKVSYTSNLGIVLLVFIGYACIGFLDDFLSVRKGDNEGLTVYQKLIMQVLIAIGFFYIYMRSGGQTAWVVGTLGIDLELGWLYGLAILFVLVGASNAVNLTDGLDGLAGGLSAIAFIAFALIFAADIHTE
jgi:phospho-N-acetylmuramoyl-pentapeptide-transferase